MNNRIIDPLCSRNDLPLEYSLLHPSVLRLGQGGFPIFDCKNHNTTFTLLFDICLEAPPPCLEPVILGYLPLYHTFGLHFFGFRYDKT